MGTRLDVGREYTVASVWQILGSHGAGQAFVHSDCYNQMPHIGYHTENALLMILEEAGCPVDSVLGVCSLWKVAFFCTHKLEQKGQGHLSFL